MASLFQGDHRKKKTLRTRVMYSFFLVIFALIGQSFYNSWREHKLIGKQKTALDKELASLKERQAALVNQIESLKTEAGREALLREKFKLGKPGEGVVVVVDNRSKEATNTNKAIDPQSIASGVWGKTVGFFTRLFKK